MFMDNNYVHDVFLAVSFVPGSGHRRLGYRVTGPSLAN